jgi:cellulose synthase/poly-beta-1,6-N-acetylglucosamine synthase-like glycosyltransferase
VLLSPTFWIIFAASELAAALMMTGLLLLSESRMKHLAQQPVVERNEWPAVSIVVAARNEERNMEAGVRSLLALDYPALQITVVNDRSTDSTGEILHRVAQEQPRLNVVDIVELPDGWLGKNHALHRGAEQSSGELLLFTDADVVFEPSALRRAVEHMEANRVDHLAVTPVVESPSYWMLAFVPVFSMCFLIFVNAWRIRNLKSSAHVGIGAFNLVRRKAYLAIGGHSKLALRPDDDLKLGKVLKLGGFQPDLMVGRGLVRVEWYRTLWELIRGLEKNAFAGVDYKPAVTIVSTIGLLMSFVAPYVLMWFAPWPANVMFAGCAAIYWFLAARACRANGQSMTYALWFPIGIVVFVLIQWRTMWLNLRQGGIYWRDTFYPLEQLRKNMV